MRDGRRRGHPALLPRSAPGGRAAASASSRGSTSSPWPCRHARNEAARRAGARHRLQQSVTLCGARPYGMAPPSPLSNARMKAKPSGLAAIVLAAGQGTRMRSALPKVAHEVGGRALIAHVVAALASCVASARAGVGPGGDGRGGEAAADAARGVDARRRRAARAPRHRHAVRRRARRWRGSAARAGALRRHAAGHRAETLRGLLAARRAPARGVVVLGFRPADPRGYGRLVSGATRALEAIVEARDARRRDAPASALQLRRHGGRPAPLVRACWPRSATTTPRASTT